MPAKALLIDPFTRSISSVTTPDTDDAAAIAHIIDAQYIESLQIDGKVLVLLNEEGLVHIDAYLNDSAAGHPFFILSQNGRSVLLLGKALVVGDDGVGGIDDCPITEAALRSLVHFVHDTRGAARIGAELRQFLFSDGSPDANSAMRRELARRATLLETFRALDRARST